LKERLTKGLVLAALDLNKKIKMEVDMLDYVIEEVLSIKCEYRWWNPVAYLSKSLNETERNYKIHDKKVIKLKTSVRECQVQVQDLNRP